MRFLANQAACYLDDLRHTRHAANEHQLVDVAFGYLRILQARFDRWNSALDQVIRKLFELCASQFFLDVLRPARVRGDKRQVNFIFLGTRQRDLRFFSFFLDALDRVGLLGQIDAGVLFEFGDDPIHDLRIPVVTAKVRVAVGRFHFENAVADFEN